MEPKVTDTHRLAELAAAATPGPYEVRRYQNGAGRLSDAATDNILIADLYHEVDREYFAACDPATIRSLVAAVRERDELRAAAEAFLRAMETFGLASSPPWVAERADALRAALHREDGA